MKEILIYLSVAIAGLVVFGYSLHMLVGGLVAPETERLIIIIGCSIAAVVMALMAWDVVKRRRSQH